MGKVTSDGHSNAPLLHKSYCASACYAQVQQQFTTNYNKISADAAKDNQKWNGGDPALGYKCSSAPALL